MKILKLEKKRNFQARKSTRWMDENGRFRSFHCSRTLRCFWNWLRRKKVILQGRFLQSCQYWCLQSGSLATNSRWNANLHILRIEICEATYVTSVFSLCFIFMIFMSDHENLLKARSTYMQQLWVLLDECKACASKMENLLFNGMWKSKVTPKLPLSLLQKVWLHSHWPFYFKNTPGSASIWACDSHGQLYFKADPLAATEVVDNAGGPMKHIEGQGSSNHHLD